MTSNVLSQRSDPRFDTSTGPCEQPRDLASEPNQASPSSLSPKEFLIDKVTIAPPLDSELGGVASPALSLILVEVGSLTLTIGGQVKTATSGDIVLWSHAGCRLACFGRPGAIQHYLDEAPCRELAPPWSLYRGYGWGGAICCDAAEVFVTTRAELLAARDRPWSVRQLSR